MNNKNIESILADIFKANKDWASLPIKKKKSIIGESITELPQDDQDKIRGNLDIIKSNKKLDIYLGNSILFYEGLGTKKKVKKKKNMYFTQDTENAIIEYNNCDDEIKKNIIYNGRIEHAFFKLTQNIIHTFKFYYLDVDSIEELQHQVITFLIEKLPLFKSGKGKAFSYFGTIAKRYLIVYNTKNYSNLQNKSQLDEVDKDKTILNDLYHNHIHDSNITEFLNMFIIYIDKNMEKIFKKKKDIQIADAILEIFKKRDVIDIFNKKAIYIYLKEMVDAETFQITRVITKYKIIYKKLYNEYHDEGYINFG